MQRPRERIGVALVMRGLMGSGKTKIGEVMGSLFPRHYFLVDDPRYVTGRFSAHMATCLLLQADEAVWAGDKAAEGRLKGLVTSTIQQIEAKGIDPIRLPNYVRLIMTSNERGCGQEMVECRCGMSGLSSDKTGGCWQIIVSLVGRASPGAGSKASRQLGRRANARAVAILKVG